MPTERRETRTESKYFGKILISESKLSDAGNLVYTVEIRDDLFNNDILKERLIDILEKIFQTYFNKLKVKFGQTVLVAALGNDKVTADSIGSAVSDRLIVTSHLYSDKKIASRFGNLATIKCGVSGTTGISSYDVLTSVSAKIRPSLIIAVDALACASTSRLAHTIQFSDRGIEPGGGVGNVQPKLDCASLGVPVLAVGVPLVMYVRKIIAELCPDSNAEFDDAAANLVVTGKEIDFQVKDFAYVLAESINRAVHRMNSTV